MPRLRSYWQNLVHRRRRDGELDEELRSTHALLEEEHLRAGATPQEARRLARLQLGSLDALAEQVKDVRAGAWVGALLQDAKHGLRLLRRNPIFAATAILSLAIGIGATTAIFTVANGLLLRTAAGVADPDRLVDIVRLERGEAGVDPVSYPDYLDIRRRATTLDGVYGYHLELEPVSLRIADTAERAFANAVTMNFFDVLGVAPVAGRLFARGDSEAPGEAPLAVLNHRFWVRRFDGDRSVVGRVVRINGHPFTIVGVAAEGFDGVGVLAADLWLPVSMIGIAEPGSDLTRLRVRESGWLLLGGRLRPGVSRAQASAEVAAIGAALAREFPFDPKYVPPGMSAAPVDWAAVAASPIPAGMRTVAALFLALLMAIVSVVLAIACANVAGILLTRGAVRRREIALRSALGAGRTRVIGQLLTETVVLFSIGGGVGLLLARLLTRGLFALLPALPVPVNLSTPLDARVIAFAVGIAFVSALLSGLVPALHASRMDVVSALKDDAQAPVRRLRLRNAFVVVQVAFSTLLVIVAAVLARGFDQVRAVERGIDARGVDIATVDLRMAGHTDASGSALARDLLERVRAIPRVEAATIANRAPGPGSMNFGYVTVPGLTPPGGAGYFPMSWTLTTSGYFETLRIRLLEGRDFSAGDDRGGERVAILGERAARRFWPEGSAVGRWIQIHAKHPSTGSEGAPVRVVGVVADVDLRGGRGEIPLALYVPLQQQFTPNLTVLTRSADGGTLAAQLHVALSAADRDLPILAAQTLASAQDGPVETQLRIGAAVAASVGFVGLLLAAIGVYGVTAYSVARRTREIGVRMSLGARRATVVALVLRQAMQLVATGAGIGLLLGIVAGRMLSGDPLRVPPPDLPLIAAVAALLAAVGFAASYVPVRRAVGIRAVEALRAE